MGEEDTEAETMSEEKMLSFILKMPLQHLGSVSVARC